MALPNALLYRLCKYTVKGICGLVYHRFHFISKGKGCISCLVFVLFRDYLCKVGYGWMYCIKYYDADFYLHIDRLILFFFAIKHLCNFAFTGMCSEHIKRLLLAEWKFHNETERFYEKIL